MPARPGTVSRGSTSEASPALVIEKVLGIVPAARVSGPEAGAGGMEVACGEGSLVLLEVQPEGKRPMSAREFLAGHPLRKGSRPFGGEPGQN